MMSILITIPGGKRQKEVFDRFDAEHKMVVKDFTGLEELERFLMKKEAEPLA